MDFLELNLPVNLVATALKTFLQDLPVPVVPQEFYGPIKAAVGERNGRPWSNEQRMEVLFDKIHNGACHFARLHQQSRPIEHDSRHFTQLSQSQLHGTQVHYSAHTEV